MNSSGSIPAAKSRRSWLIAVPVITTAVLVSLILNGSLARRERVFRGKGESEWIRNLKYSDDDQVKEWRGYGEDGVQVLIRGLENATHPGQRAYRRLSRRLPVFVIRWLPAPKPDSTRSTRMCLVSLLSSLGNLATNATPVMIRTVCNDEDDSVRQSALCYFNSSEDENCLLNKLPPNQKRALLPALIRAIQNKGNWGLRNNAALALKFYPEQREVVAPVLANAMQDPEPHVRLLSAQALNRVDPDTAKKAGATATIVAISRHPDDQLASKAVAALGRSGSEPDMAVPALIACLQSTNTLVACEAVWALEWAPKDFNAFSARIIPALSNAAQRKDNVAGYARIASTKWTSRSDSNRPQNSN